MSFLAPWVEHGIFGGPEAQQVPHLIAKFGEILAQVVQIFHRGLVCALHLLPCGGQVAVNQTAHDLLVVLITLLLQVLPLLDGKDSERIQIDDKILHQAQMALHSRVGKETEFNLSEKIKINALAAILLQQFKPVQYFSYLEAVLSFHLAL